MNGPCRSCPNHPEPDLNPPAEVEEDALTVEEIADIKADERQDERRGK